MYTFLIEIFNTLREENLVPGRADLVLVPLCIKRTYMQQDIFARLTHRHVMVTDGHETQLLWGIAAYI